MIGRAGGKMSTLPFIFNSFTILEAYLVYLSLTYWIWLRFTAQMSKWKIPNNHSANLLKNLGTRIFRTTMANSLIIIWNVIVFARNETVSLVWESFVISEKVTRIIIQGDVSWTNSGWQAERGSISQMGTRQNKKNIRRARLVAIFKIAASKSWPSQK